MATGETLSLDSLIDLGTVLGIAVRNSIMLISHYRRLEEQEWGSFGPGLNPGRKRTFRAHFDVGFMRIAGPAADRACSQRTRARDRSPDAAVILGGLVMSTLLTLVLLPSLHLVQRKSAAKVNDVSEPSPVGG